MNQYIRAFPITSAVIGINIIIFIAINSGLLPAYDYLSLPGALSVGSFIAHFSHMEFLHIAMNMVVFFQISPLIERAVSKVEYITILLGIWLGTVFLAQPFVTNPSLGFSGILMGLITVTIGLYYHFPALRKTLIMWTVINIAIGLLPQISFLMHFVGAMVGIIVVLLYKVTQKK